MYAICSDRIMHHARVEAEAEGGGTLGDEIPPTCRMKSGSAAAYCSGVIHVTVPYPPTKRTSTIFPITKYRVFASGIVLESWGDLFSFVCSVLGFILLLLLAKSSLASFLLSSVTGYTSPNSVTRALFRPVHPGA